MNPPTDTPNPLATQRAILQGIAAAADVAAIHQRVQQQFTAAMRGIRPATPSDLARVETALAPLLRTAIQQITDMAKAMLPVLTRTAALLRTWVNSPEYVAGLCGTMYVRGALDPAYAAPEDRDTYATHLLRSDPDLRLLTPENRATVVAAFMRGWLEHRGGEDHATYPWHRRIGSTVLTVSGAA